MINKIVDYIIKEVQEKSELSGFQNIVLYSDISEKFSGEIEEYFQNLVMDSLLKREEIADVILDTDGFDIVLYTDFAPNYKEEDYFEDC